MDSHPFNHASAGLTRFPPNVEQISVTGTSDAVFLSMRRNDVRLEFALSKLDCAHLATMLLATAGREPPDDRA